MSVLFVAQTADASCYHRVMLPAMTLGVDWVGFDAPPPEPRVGRGKMAPLESYDVVVVQGPVGDSWLPVVEGLQAAGTRVLYDLDFDLHAFGAAREALAPIERLARMADGLICANETIAKRYRKFNPRVHVCESGLDLSLYSLSRPEHTTINIGWAGRSLTPQEMETWLLSVLGVMRSREVTNFISIGEPYADVIANSGQVEPERCLAIPYSLPEQYPAPLTLLDIAFDPLGRAPWRRARSPLRWLEAGARGIPFVGDRRVYPFEHGRTGFHAGTPDSLAQTLVRLVDDPGLRDSVGAAAREEVERRYSMQALASRWAEALA